MAKTKRDKCEKALAEKIWEIHDLIKQFYPKNTSLSIYMSGEYISCNNQYFDEDAKRPIDFYQCGRNEKLRQHKIKKESEET